MIFGCVREAGQSSPGPGPGPGHQPRPWPGARAGRSDIIAKHLLNNLGGVEGEAKVMSADSVGVGRIAFSMEGDYGWFACQCRGSVVLCWVESMSFARLSPSPKGHGDGRGMHRPRGPSSCSSGPRAALGSRAGRGVAAPRPFRRVCASSRRPRWARAAKSRPRPSTEGPSCPPGSERPRPAAEAASGCVPPAPFSAGWPPRRRANAR